MASPENLKSQKDARDARDAVRVWADRRYAAIMSGSKNSEGEACGTRHDVKNSQLNTSGRVNQKR